MCVCMDGQRMRKRHKGLQMNLHNNCLSINGFTTKKSVVMQCNKLMCFIKFTKCEVYQKHLNAEVN